MRWKKHRLSLDENNSKKLADTVSVEGARNDLAISSTHISPWWCRPPSRRKTSLRNTVQAAAACSPRASKVGRKYAHSRLWQHALQPGG